MEELHTKKIIGRVLMLAMICILLSGCEDEIDYSASETVGTNGERAFDEASVDDSIESATIMVYMTASDLESEGGCATDDITEMLYANHSDAVNIVLQTGGTTDWQNSVMTPDTVERWVVAENGELTKVDELGDVCMVDSDILSDFIMWATDNYPADRYGFIFWDHGGGTAMGYGADENYPNEALSIGEMSEAFYHAGTHFDFVGFDACLMGTVENAYVFSSYSDYLIASEETEPGDGWYYTDFLSTLSDQPGISIEALGQQIAEDYVDNLSSSANNVTLSVIDLSKIDSVMNNLYAYMEKSDSLLYEYGFEELASARAMSRDFGNGEFEQIDILDYVSRVESTDGSELVSSIQDAIVYNISTMEGANGLAMYYPYYVPDAYESVSADIREAGLTDSSYITYFNDFVSIMVYGHANHESSQSQYAYQQSDSEWSDLEDEDWFSGVADVYSDCFENSEMDELSLDDKGDYYALHLTDEDWDVVSKIEQQVYVDDGEGYLELGYDDFYRFDDDGDLIVEFDYTWLHLNDCIVPFYTLENGTLANGEMYSYGFIPAILNDSSRIKIMVCWDEEHEEPYVRGYCEMQEGMSMSSRCLLQLKKGDSLRFCFDYYTYDGDYEDEYELNDNSFIYDGGDLTVSYEEIGDCVVNVCFHLEDVYQNDYWTETICYGL